MMMHKSYALRSLVAGTVAVVGCAGGSAVPPGRAVSEIRTRAAVDGVAAEDVRAVAAGHRAFAAAARPHALRADANGMFSPYSLATALGMAQAGARGETAAEMSRVLGHSLPAARHHAAQNALDRALENRAREGLLLRTANALFADQSQRVERAYADLLATNYDVGIRLLDFGADAEGARRAINGWIGEVTVGKIPELFGSGAIHGETRLVLVNAVYFYGPWRYTFERSRTSQQPFQLADGTSVSVATMVRKASYRVARGDGWRAVEIPYKHEELAMLAVVPEGRSLQDLEQGLTAERLSEIAGAVAQSGQEVELHLPRFTFRSRWDATRPLAEMGMPQAFSSEADFSGMTGMRDVRIEHVIHEAFIEVNEEGTEAAAATGVSFGPASAPLFTEFRIDRPFFFVIVDRPTGEPLFAGHVVDPRAS